MAIVALACLSGAGQGYRSVSRFAKRLNKLQRRALRCWINPNTGQSQVPSESVVQRVLQKVPRLEVELIAVVWQNDLLGAAPASDTVVIDGKEVRGGDVMLVNAIAQPSQRLQGVEPVAQKTNEIPTAQTLIRRLDLTGRIIQLDGMHTQHQTAYQSLYEQGADYSMIPTDDSQNGPATPAGQRFPLGWKRSGIGAVAGSIGPLSPRRLSPRNWAWRVPSRSLGSIAASAPEGSCTLHGWSLLEAPASSTKLSGCAWNNNVGAWRTALIIPWM